MSDGRGSWAVSSQDGNSLSGGDPDRRNPSAVDWSDVGGAGGGSRVDRVGVGAGAVGDGKSLRCGGGVGMVSHGEGG